MIPDKLKQLIKLLTEKTQAKKAIWNKMSGNSQFKLSLSEGIAITVDNWANDWDEIYEVIIFNVNGDAIERYVSDRDTVPEDNQLLKSFHKAASDQYFKVEETMDLLLKSITSQETIGTADTGKEAPDDDDLPF